MGDRERGMKKGRWRKEDGDGERETSGKSGEIGMEMER